MVFRYYILINRKTRLSIATLEKYNQTRKIVSATQKNNDKLKSIFERKKMVIEALFSGVVVVVVVKS